MADETKSLVTAGEATAGELPSWYLAVAMDASRPFAGGVRLSLAGVTEVSVGRGPERGAQRAGTTLRLDLDDPFQSHEHFRLRRDGAGWRLDDCGSKNGTGLRGRRTSQATVVDGDVIEAGATFMVLRQTDAEVADRTVGPDELSGSRTLNARLERELELVGRLASTNLPILIRGESGSGKELVARAVHEMSGRRGAWVPVNCGALPATIVESELFGARRGAFTGAVDDRPGLIQSAAGGTIFLDEIAELPPSAQAAILRFLQEGELRPLGSPKTMQVDVRVVAATHRDLDAMVVRETFRRDLAARLAGHVLTLPPLRGRREDLGLLCADILRRIEGGARSERALERAAARALFAHEWLGNVRDLEYALRSATARSGAKIGLEHLPEAIRAPAAAAERAAPLAGGERRELIVRLLDEHGGNQSAVARALGTSRAQLRRLALRLGIDLRPQK